MLHKKMIEIPFYLNFLGYKLHERWFIIKSMRRNTKIYEKNLSLSWSKMNLWETLLNNFLQRIHRRWILHSKPTIMTYHYTQRLFRMTTAGTSYMFCQKTKDKILLLKLLYQLKDKMFYQDIVIKIALEYV